jgi:hypothetical protein
MLDKAVIGSVVFVGIGAAGVADVVLAVSTAADGTFAPFGGLPPPGDLGDPNIAFLFS